MKLHFFGGIKLKIKGVNQERNFSDLANKYPLFKIKRFSQTEAQFSVYLKNEKAILKNLNKYGFHVESIKRFGLLYRLKKFAMSWGIISALFFGLVFFILNSFFIFQINIIGEERLTSAQIENCLFESGLKKYALKSNVNTKDLEKELIKKLDDLSLVSIIIKGNTLIVSVKEKILNEEYENSGKFTPLEAKFSGEITKITLIQGTLKVKVGDIVHAGEILVEPFIIDLSGNKRGVKAEAEISARVWLCAKEEHYNSRIETVRTGKQIRFINLKFLGLNLTNTHVKDAPFKSFETVTKTTCISYFNFLPIYREEILFFETKIEIIEQPFLEHKEQIIEKAKQKSLELKNDDDILLREFHNETMLAGKIIVEYVVEVERLIS